MSRSLHDQTLALAGIFQAAALVREIAHTGYCNEAAMETCIRSLFATDPEPTLDVYGGELSDTRDGLRVLSTVIAQHARPPDPEVRRSVRDLLHLASTP